jgi:hypothetical protein
VTARGARRTSAAGDPEPTRAKAVLWISHRRGERCAVCGIELDLGSFIQLNREQGLRCAACAGFGDLVFAPSGDPALTRRAVALSRRSAVVVKFSRARRRHERQGVIVEADALARAEELCRADAERRQRARERQQPRRERAEQQYVERFTARIRALFPSCPAAEADEIAQRTCATRSGRVGRSGAAKALDADAVTLAVRAHIRHAHTAYENLLAGRRRAGRCPPAGLR